MTKNKVLSKFNFKDYNNELELVLEKKDFSSDAKNLLLSMLYKIEVGYKDYKTVKQDVISKEAFIEAIIDTIKNKCEKIEFIKPIEGITENFKVIPEENKIECYQNETSLLEGILVLEEKEFYIKEDYQALAIPIKELISKGYEEDKYEIITNFDGWSWNPKKENSIYMKCYQILRILMGYNFIYNWKKSLEKIDYLEEIRNYSENLYWGLCKIAILLYSRDTKQKKQILDEKVNFENELKKMEDKKEYLKEIYAKRRALNNTIKKCDKIINNKELLLQEFNARNKLLQDEEKIFSISDLTDLLQKEKENISEEMRKVASMAEPKNYVKKSKDLEDKIKLVKQIEASLTSKKKIEEAICSVLANLQQILIENLTCKLEKVENKKEIMELLYHYRYYYYINESSKTKELEKLEKDIITKACKLKALAILHEDIEYNSKIIDKVITNSIIELGNIILILKANENLEIEVYDGETFDRIEQMELENEKNFTVKLGKKIKLVE